MGFGGSRRGLWCATIGLLVASVVVAVPASAASGDLDPTFDGDGIAVTDFAAAVAVAVQADGKVVAVGGPFDGGDQLFGVVRYNPDGSLDAGFGSDGIVLTQPARPEVTVKRSRASAVAIQPDGKIVVAGTTSEVPWTTTSVIAVVRYNADGTLDDSFGDGGIVRTQASAGSSQFSGARAVALQADGRIVVAGSTSDSAGEEAFAVVRYTADGLLDSSFAGDGIARTRLADPAAFIRFAHAYAVAVQADGKIVAAGRTIVAGVGPSPLAPVIGLVRYNSDGSLDATFGDDGVVRTQAADPSAQPQGSGADAVLLQADGKVVVGGSTTDGTNDPVQALVRYNPDGGLDPDFGDGGVVRTQTSHPGATNPVATFGGAAVQSDGRIVTAGGALAQDRSVVFAVVRYLADGSLDPSFGSGGIARTQAAAPAPAEQFSAARAVAIQADGKIVAAGEAAIAEFRNGMAVVRYLDGGGGPAVLAAEADSFLRSRAQTRNEGANPFLRVNRDRREQTVVAFDLSDVDPAGVAEATLVLTIADNADNWGRRGDRTIHNHPLLVDFTEGNGVNSIVPRAERSRGAGAGTTWMCATDDEIANGDHDCLFPRWFGGDYGQESGVAHVVNGQTGEISFDVTADVQAGFDGWLLARGEDGSAGRVDFYSKEHPAVAGNPDLAPRLVISGG